MIYLGKFFEGLPACGRRPPKSAPGTGSQCSSFLVRVVSALSEVQPCSAPPAAGVPDRQTVQKAVRCKMQVEDDYEGNHQHGAWSQFSAGGSSPWNETELAWRCMVRNLSRWTRRLLTEPMGLKQWSFPVGDWGAYSLGPIFEPYIERRSMLNLTGGHRLVRPKRTAAVLYGSVTL